MFVQKLKFKKEIFFISVMLCDTLNAHPQILRRKRMSKWVHQQNNREEIIHQDAQRKLNKIVNQGVAEPPPPKEKNGHEGGYI